MKINLLLITLICFCLTACSKQENNSSIVENSRLIIKAGYMCGWGSGEDSLIISRALIKYYYSVPANSQVPEIYKTRATTTAEWNDILNSFRIDDFLNLHYNSCNICVDGCDEWISISNDSVSHLIRFGLGARIDSIKQLQNVLSKLRSEFRN